MIGFIFEILQLRLATKIPPSTEGFDAVSLRQYRGDK